MDGLGSGGWIKGYWYNGAGVADRWIWIRCQPSGAGGYDRLMPMQRCVVAVDFFRLVCFMGMVHNLSVDSNIAHFLILPSDIWFPCGKHILICNRYPFEGIINIRNSPALRTPTPLPSRSQHASQPADQPNRYAERKHLTLHPAGATRTNVGEHNGQRPRGCIGRPPGSEAGSVAKPTSLSSEAALAGTGRPGMRQHSVS